MRCGHVGRAPEPVLVDGDNFLPLVVAVSQAAGLGGAGHEEAG